MSTRKRIFRKGVVYALILALICSYAVTILAAEEPIRLIVNGREIKPDVPPQTIDGRTMVPVRWVSEALGAQVSWDEAKLAVLVNSTPDQAAARGSQIQLIVDGIAVQPDVPPVIVEGRTLVPVRWVAEALGAQVDWDASARTVTITSGNGVKVKVIPNQYNEYFAVAEDELFIMVEGNNRYENPGVLDKIFVNKLKERFPDVKFNMVAWDRPIRFEEVVAAGVVPDIVLTSNRFTVEKYGWAYDMKDLIRQYGIDLSKMNPAVIEVYNWMGQGSAIYAVPLFLEENVLFYNKLIFDKFGVEYPKLGITRDEAYELAKKLTGQIGTTNYKGYSEHPDKYMTNNQLGLIPYTSTGTWNPTRQQIKENINILTEDWLRLTEDMYRFLAIRGNVYDSVDDDFFKGQRAAMGVYNAVNVFPYMVIEGYFKEQYREIYEGWKKNLDLGAVNVPVFSDHPTTIYQPNEFGLYLTKQSNKKELAMEVIKYMVSEEYQLELSKHALKSIYNTPQMMEVYGDYYPELSEIDGLKEAVYWGENAAPKNYEYTKPVQNFPLWYVFRQYVLQEGNSPEGALYQASEAIQNWYGW